MKPGAKKLESATWLWSDGRYVRQSSSEKQADARDCSLLYKRARYYDPTTGEFLSRDPLEYVDGMSQYRGYFVPGGTDPLGEVSMWLQNQFKGPFKFTSGDITATFYLDADRTKGATNNPDPAKYQTPPNYVAGVEVTAVDSKAGEPCSDGCGIRAWASFKWQRSSSLHVWSWGKNNTSNPHPKIPLDTNWVSDGGGFSTTENFYDYPTRGKKSWGSNLTWEEAVQEYAIAIVCVCASDGSTVEKKAISILHYKFETDLSNQVTRITFENKVTSDLPNPGWADIRGIESVETCPRLK